MNSSQQDTQAMLQSFAASNLDIILMLLTNTPGWLFLDNMLTF